MVVVGGVGGLSKALMMVNVSFHHVVSAYAAAQPQNCGMACREKFSTGRARECIKLPGNYNIKKDSIEIKIKNSLCSFALC